MNTHEGLADWLDTMFSRHVAHATAAGIRKAVGAHAHHCFAARVYLDLMRIYAAARQPEASP